MDLDLVHKACILRPSRSAFVCPVWFHEFFITFFHLKEWIWERKFIGCVIIIVKIFKPSMLNNRLSIFLSVLISESPNFRRAKAPSAALSGLTGPLELDLYDYKSTMFAAFDQRPKFYGRSRRFKTYGYRYGGRSLRPFLQPKVVLVVFLVFSKMEAEMCFSLQ